MKRIGIIGGLSPASTVDYYRHIIKASERYELGLNYPEIIIYSLNFQKVIDSGYASEDQILKTLWALKNAGADFAIAACNSIHKIYDELKNQSPIPWISIMEPAIEAIKHQGISCVGLLGTKFTMDNDFFYSALKKNNIEVVTPSGKLQTKLNSIIYDELIVEAITDASLQLALEVEEDLAKKGAQGAILACTELPYLFRGNKNSFKYYNTAALHANYALKVAMT